MTTTCAVSSLLELFIFIYMRKLFLKNKVQDEQVKST